ncbi:MAG: hypothetical protein P4L10_03615 [Acidobacteriaceae bacterium]|jgi:hypothetical protein|nr:hypothetical protein [Acidobacteriaceae bacterium]
MSVLRAVFSLGLFLYLSAQTLAQNTVSVATDFSKPGQTASDTCKAEVQAFMRMATVYPHPATGWHFVIVCDESTWKIFLQKAGLNNEPGEHYGETDIDKNITVIRGWRLIHPDTLVSPEHIVAHELAHIILHSRDEVEVDKQAQAWMEQEKLSPGSLVRPTLAATITPPQNSAK